MIDLISLKAQSIDGSRKLKVNEPFQVATPGIANLLVKTGRAKYPDAEPNGGSSGKYKRRDMRAES